MWIQVAAQLRIRVNCASWRYCSAWRIRPVDCRASLTLSGSRTMQNHSLLSIRRSGTQSLDEPRPRMSPLNYIGQHVLLGKTSLGVLILSQAQGPKLSQSALPRESWVMTGWNLASRIGVITSALVWRLGESWSRVKKAQLIKYLKCGNTRKWTQKVGLPIVSARKKKDLL